METKSKIFKARLVACGFDKVGIMDAVRAPVAKLSPFRIFISVCCWKGFVMRHIDIKNAYLNGCIDRDVYMETPQYLKAEKDLVCKLQKAIYSLKKSGLIWNNAIDNVLRKCGFQRPNLDYCNYVLKEGLDVCYVLLYVDDILVGSNRDELIVHVSKVLQRNFGIRNLGSPSKFLGMNINYE